MKGCTSRIAAFAASVLLLSQGTVATAADDGGMTLANSMVALGDFKLTDHFGKSFVFSSLRGTPTLVFFGFTHCPSVCPAAMNELRLLTESMRKAGDVVPRVVMISVDGDRDSPEAMRAYLEPLSRDFIGLTGDPRLVRDIAARFSAVFFKGLPGDSSGNYEVQHTSLIYLVDGEGVLRASFLTTPLEQMAETVRSVAGSPAKAT